MPTSPFPGFPSFLDAAAIAIGHPEAAAPARRIAVIAALANLCAQAATSNENHVQGIMAKAEEFRDQLQCASRAAELMLNDLRSRRGLVTTVAVESPQPRLADASTPASPGAFAESIPTSIRARKDRTPR